MLKNLKFALCAFAISAVLVSCANEQAGNANDAEASLTNNSTVVDPNAAATPTTPPPAQAAPTGPTTTVAFGETEYDFGTVDQGAVVEHVFTFTNSGSEPLVISNAKGSCGCTVPEWPKEPIAPGATGEITVKFDSKGKKNAQNKKVTIIIKNAKSSYFIKTQKL